MLNRMGHASVAEWIDQLQAHGRYTFSKREAVSAAGEGEKAVEKALRRLKEKGRIVRPRQEYYVIVPLEYRTAGAPPPSWYVHDLMRFLGEPYYVGLLTASRLHGAAHQRPQEFQVLCKRSMREQKVGRARIRYFRKKNVEKGATGRRVTETGYMLVSSPAQTAIDLLRYVRRCGYLDNVATVLAALGEKIDPDELLEVAARDELANVQRLGYLLEHLGHGSVAGPLHAWVQDRSPARVRLQKGGGRDAADLDDRWKVYVNVELAPDL
jgi:predicted transcriptional regulator of viral defense system